jgi:hypothetical protein
LTSDGLAEDMLKIGMTTRTPEIRAHELYESVTGVPSKFVVSFKREVADCILAEKLLHARLDNFRPNNSREFFKLPIASAVKLLTDVCDEVDLLFSKNTPISRSEILGCDSKVEEIVLPASVNKIALQAEEEIRRLTESALNRISETDSHVESLRNEIDIETKSSNEYEVYVPSEFKISWYHWVLFVIILKGIFSIFKQ